MYNDFKHKLSSEQVEKFIYKYLKDQKRNWYQTKFFTSLEYQFWIKYLKATRYKYVCNLETNYGWIHITPEEIIYTGKFQTLSWKLLSEDENIYMYEWITRNGSEILEAICEIEDIDWVGNPYSKFKNNK